MRERWATFSVKDHLSDAPFVSDVLLYDRLIIPVPPEIKTQDDIKFWEKYKPEQQETCLDILKVKTASQDGLALTVPWNESKRERFRNNMSFAAGFSAQRRYPNQDYYTDPFELTKELIKDEFLPALPPGVAKAWTVSAFNSSKAYHRAITKADPHRKRQLAAIISHRFLTPAGKDSNHEILKRAVDLATTDDFRRKRRAFYEAQERIIEDNISDANAVQGLENLLVEYHKATRIANVNVLKRYAFTVIPSVASITGALVTHSEVGMIVTGIGGLVSLARFLIFDSKPLIERGDLDAVAMIYDAREKLPLR